MTTIKITHLRNNLFEILDNCVKYDKPVSINTKSGTAVLISEEEYNGLKETAYLSSLPGIKKRIVKGMKTPLSKCKTVKIDEL